MLRLAAACLLLATWTPAQERAPSPDPAAAADAGLRWLLAHQDESGLWDPGSFPRHDGDNPTDGPGKDLTPTGATALVALALLARGHRLGQGEHHEALARAIAALTHQQQEDGRMVAKGASLAVLEQAMATLALSEACALSPNAAASVTDGAAKAASCLLELRGEHGAWSSSDRESDVDLRTTLWATLAVLSAASSAGIAAGDAVARVQTWIEKAHLPSAMEAATHAQLGFELAVRVLAGDRGEQAKRLAARLAEQRPGDEPKDTVDRLAYHASAFGLWHIGGEPWRRWSEAFLAHAVATQRSDGAFAGSWDPVGPEAKSGGRIEATVSMVLALAVQERFANVPGIGARRVRRK